MCGLLFALNFGRQHLDKEQFSDALDLLAHRGPDGRGVFNQRVGNVDVFLGHRRLSVFDLSQAGAQPMKDHRDRQIVFNGEIFNWRELAQELRGLGHRFRSQCDTEVILAAYDEWGEACLQRFVGFWAFAILDPETRSVFVSRDRFGIKPLYFSTDGDLWVFSSEIKGIWPVLGRPAEIRHDQLARCLIYSQSDDSEHTIYKGIMELQPATSMRICLHTQSFSQSRYWKLEDTEPSVLSDNEALERFQEHVELAASQWARSDRNFAITLSGGVDSSVVALALTRTGHKGVSAYTSSFPEHKELDETRYAKQVATKLGMQHHCIEPDLRDLEKENKRVTWHQELLYPTGSILVNWCVIKQMKADGVVTYMTGQGGDEVFLGYEYYFVPSILNRWRRPWDLVSAASSASKNSRLSMAELLAYLVYYKAGKLREARYLHKAKKIYSSEFIASLNSRVKSIPSDIRELQVGEITGQKLRRLLRYDDRVCTAHGLESRPMLLDHRLVEFGFGLGEKHKLRDGWSKYIMRRYLDRHGLPGVAWRTEKLGYPAPSAHWVKSWKKEGTLNQLSGIAKRNLGWESIPADQLFTVHNLGETAKTMSWPTHEW